MKKKRKKVLISNGLMVFEDLAPVVEEYLEAAREWCREVDRLPLWKVVDDSFHDPRYDNPDESIERLRREIEAGTVSCRRVDLPSDHGSIRPGDFTGGDDHRLGCAIAASWLDSEGRGHTTHPLDCPGGKADVLSVDRKLTVEVGHTRALKILRCLARGLEVLMVPYITFHRFGVLLVATDGGEKLRAIERQDKIENQFTATGVVDIFNAAFSSPLQRDLEVYPPREDGEDPYRVQVLVSARRKW